MVTRLRGGGWNVLLRGYRTSNLPHSAPCFPLSFIRHASSHGGKTLDTSAGSHSEPSSQGHGGGGHGSHGNGDGHGHGHGHGHDDHHHDPYATWYEEPPNNLIFRNTFLKMPFYIGSPPEMTYRTPPKPSPVMEWAGYIWGTIMWWWILWGILDEPGHVTGEYFFPDRSQFTDTELGIPPLDWTPPEHDSKFVVPLRDSALLNLWLSVYIGNRSVWFVNGTVSRNHYYEAELTPNMMK